MTKILDIFQDFKHFIGSFNAKTGQTTFSIRKCTKKFKISRSHMRVQGIEHIHNEST